MYEICKKLHFCYGHRLLNYEGPCRHLHGHNAVVDVGLVTESLDGRGMVVDFSDIKQRLDAWIRSELDHCMLLHKDDPLVPILQERNERLYTLEFNPTAENLARLIYERAGELDLPVQSIGFWETPNNFAAWRG